MAYHLLRTTCGSCKSCDRYGACVGSKHGLRPGDLPPQWGSGLASCEHLCLQRALVDWLCAKAKRRPHLIKQCKYFRFEFFPFWHSFNSEIDLGYALQARQVKADDGYVLAT